MPTPARASDTPYPVAVEAGKDYWWCAKHCAWCRHTTEECKGLKLQDGGDTTSTQDGPPDPRLQLSAALAHLAEQDSDDSNENA